MCLIASIVEAPPRKEGFGLRENACALARGSGRHNFAVAAGSGLLPRPSSSLSPAAEAAGLLAEQRGSDAPFADGDGSGRSSESGAAAELLGDLSGWDASAHGDSIDSDATPHQDATDSDTASPGDPDSTTASLEDMGMQAIRRQS